MLPLKNDRVTDPDYQNVASLVDRPRIWGRVMFPSAVASKIEAGARLAHIGRNSIYRKLLIGSTNYPVDT